MRLMPKRVKFRKTQRGKIKGNATRGNTVCFGEYGLQSTEPGWITAEILPAATLVLLYGDVAGVHGVVRQSISSSGA